MMNLIELVLITLPLPCLVRSFDYFEYFRNHSLLYKYYLPLSYIIPCTVQTWCLHCSRLLIQFTWAFSSFISYFVTLLADKILRKIGEGKILILLILSNNLWIKYLYFFPFNFPSFDCVRYLWSSFGMLGQRFKGFGCN